MSKSLNIGSDNPLVYVIILNWNGKKYLEECIPSIKKNVYKNYRSIVVDNFSSDGSQDWLRKNHPDVILIENKKNYGFVKGNNIGIEYAIKQGAKFVALLNNDTVVDPLWLYYLVESIQEDSKIVMVGSKIYLYDNPNLINSIGGGITLLGMGYDIGLYNPDNEKFNKERFISFPCAAAMLFRSSIVDDVGLMDERYFIYSDDVEWGWRAWVYGYLVKYVPKSIVYHKYSATMSTQSFKKIYLGIRNSLCSILKDYELLTLVRLSPIIVKSYAFIFFYHIKNQNNLKNRSIMAYYLFKTLIWNVVNLPETILRRSEIQKNRKVGDRALFEKGLIDKSPFANVFIPDYKVADEDKLNFDEIGHSLDLSRDSQQLGYGWYGEETNEADGRLGRWTMDEAEFYIKKNDQRILSIELFNPLEILKENIRVNIRINNINSKSYINTFFDLKFQTLNKIDIDISSIENGILKILLKPDKSWKPMEIFKNNDSRELGVQILHGELS